ncbi:MAG: tRNA pseudouridine38-40 synthase, partial [Thermoleophilaceae bacterium]|nr:tRNA pseudouridine38-40 synthase [Thermoleophilaceae bacterium]
MTTAKLTIAYDGSPFSGWAAQSGLRSVQGEIESALEKILRRPTSLTVAGRTDAGVHAWAQVASCSLEDEVPDTLRRSLNAILPLEIAILRVEAAPDGFDARRDALSRTYCYRVVGSPVLSPFERGRALHWPYQLDREALDRCAAAIVGTHDFTAFTPTETEHVRFERNVPMADWREFALADAREGRLLELWIQADAFMHRMVRVLVGTMLEVGTGRRTV